MSAFKHSNSPPPPPLPTIQRTNWKTKSLKFTKRQANFAGLLRSEHLTLPLPDDRIKFWQKRQHFLCPLSGGFTLSSSKTKTSFTLFVFPSFLYPQHCPMSPSPVVLKWNCLPSCGQRIGCNSRTITMVGVHNATHSIWLTAFFCICLITRDYI